MSKTSVKILLILALSLGIVSGVFAQRQTGAIKGTVQDNEGNVLPGVKVEISSEAIMGIKSYITTQTGSFRFPANPPGTYTIKAEMPGFQTVKRENIIISVGTTVTISITMAMSAIEEEVTVTAAPPIIDVESTKVTTHFDLNIIENIPLPRDIYDIINAAPGAVSGEDTRYRYTSFHGSGVRSNAYAIDGVNMTGPAYGRLLTHINQDITEEIEFVTSALPAEVANASGAYINIVTRSGGNKFTGGAIVYYTDESLTKSQWTDEEVLAMEVSQPAAPKSWIDTSFTLGGPILRDRLWFFTSGRYIYNTRRTNFIPFTDPLGRYHGPYDWKHEEWMTFGKLTSKITPKLKLTAMFNFFNRARPLRGDPGPRNPTEWYTRWNEDVYTGNVQALYVLNQNTFADLRFNFAERIEGRYLTEPGADMPRIMWKGTPNETITNARWNETFDETRIRVGTYFTRFQDDFLGANHELKFGVEWEQFRLKRNYWRPDNLSWWWSKDGTPYYHGRVTHNGVPNIGRSRIYFQIGGATEESTYYLAKGRRIGAYIQDLFTIGRLTLNLGLRYDRTWGWEPPAIKGAGGNPVSVHVGKNYVAPWVASMYPEQFPDGINPFAELTSPGFDDIMVWDNFSPRVGLTFDIFGDGKTVLKASYSRYTEIMMTQYYEVLNPFYAIWVRFDWFDMNDNQEIDIGDDFTVYPYDFRRFDPEFAKLKLDPKTKCPLTDAVTIGIERELLQNFSLGATYIYKHGHNIFEAVAWSPDTGEFWYHWDLPAAKDYYVPFTTIVPGTGTYPDETVTIYLRKRTAPPMFNYAINVPELWRKYQALELKFQKRMSRGWQLLGSIVLSKSYGTWGGLGGQTWGWEVSGNQPNFYVNREGRTNIDRPFVIKLMGTVRLPYGFLFSGYYRHASGSPWARYASIRAPTSFTSANNTYRWWLGVLLEPQGSRRNPSIDILDIRLEKEFKIGNFGRLGVYMDATNILGYSGIGIGRDDIYRYSPTAENVAEPNNVTVESTYGLISSVRGVRTFRFSLRFSF